ncbi:MAG: hypothetical protein ACYSWQ_04315 [Planctomycetota bacterium]|jgi:hypothetical protein
MKIAKFLLLLIVIMALMNWMREGQQIGPLPKCLPLLHGKQPSVPYGVGGIICVLIAIAGIARLMRRDNDNDT